ncbi:MULTISPECIES: hypothetical protein [Streptomyces]|uniref:Uncharacterized protein n=1 Tax=Streptomyces tsukubensis (strain DSM 42081 / NBRC 108919 / NRRL 18488 / 9993) TaxID=1114943 RepID=I2N0P4_STRT9|nr:MULTISPECIES: hypothetical protein [Streptomyces]AZK94777.1 hypothetical protein B7R87_13570 [Streptomyces tsukubensis]EIF90591.1 hypothetical protein [Streptomyces tsukubensis NRRL18488]MYS68727.1 hypothetical protein [Streptomyces sp. SID5473]QKM69140.1 hypothetical protein STSU_020200 [Streptomyces tsukubensis NRRL18488]TAI42930.1 hypothetical protein EWI31_21335 [Streptomyces tsukubensis]
MAEIGKGLDGRGRVTVFHMFTVVFGYTTHHMDERRLGDIGVVGPLTPGVSWQELWRMAAAMNTEGASRDKLARWILLQATRAFVCGSGRIGHYDSRTWKLGPDGHRVRFADAYCNRYGLWTGDLTVAGMASDQVAMRPGLYRM